MIFSHVLYQLSYLGAVLDGRWLMAEKTGTVQRPRPCYSSASSGGEVSGDSFVGTR